MTAVSESIEERPLLDAALERGRPYHELYRGILRGQLKARRHGGRWFVSDAALDAFLAG